MTYFLLAAGPSLLVKIETALGERARNSRLLRLATVTLSNLALCIATTATMYWLGTPNPLLWGTSPASRPPCPCS